MKYEKSLPQIWGGVECTVARLGDRYRDQSRETGHWNRVDDLDRIAALGIGTVRYPVLWETISPADPEKADFSWTDTRLDRLRGLGITVIAGLCHHGSGPPYTDLLDPAWPHLLARHAQRVAERYPHLDLYTPVNEPLTTARFAALYGTWYPHHTSYQSFLGALVNECKGILLAMRAIRRVRSDAKLIQTEDLGKTFATPLLAHQAEHENQRRWLTFDLLCGLVKRDHPWWEIFTRFGVSEAELEFFLEADTPPDILGINHYLTSERYLDHRLSRYPDSCWGGNGRRRYADAEAVRMPIPHEDLGPAARLREVWQRYKRPVAITEVHHGCSRDEQLRWLVEVWNAAKELRIDGVDLRAVTVWALFGAVDWNSLLARVDAHYEPGPFDIRGQKPRKTALAQAVASLAATGSFDHPVLDRVGWWKRDIRFYHKPARRLQACRAPDSERQILITGAAGTLGRAFSRICDFRGIDHVMLTRAELDITDPASVQTALACHQPWAVINAAGYVRVAQAEYEREACFRDNTLGAEVLAHACQEFGLPLVTFSSDLVFDGTKGAPYCECDIVCPSNAYGESKAEAERRVLSANNKALVIRTSAFFGPWASNNFVWSVLNALAAGRPYTVSNDVISPTYVPDLVHEALNLLIDGATGIWHLANASQISWFDLAVLIARQAGYDESLITQEATATSPRNVALSSVRGVLLPSLESALARFVKDNEVEWIEARHQTMAAE